MVADFFPVFRLAGFAAVVDLLAPAADHQRGFLFAEILATGAARCLAILDRSNLAKPLVVFRAKAEVALGELMSVFCCFKHGKLHL